MVPSGPLPVLTCLHVCLSLILSKTDSHPHICCSWPQAAFSRRPWEKVCQSAHPIPGLLCLEELHKMVAPETEISTGHQLGAVLGISFEEGRRQRQIWAGVSGCHAGLNDSLAQPAVWSGARMLFRIDPSWEEGPGLHTPLSISH